MADTSIKYILSSIAEGDRGAFKTLFLSWYPKVKYFIVHLVKDKFVAEDLAQDVFIKIWENRQKLPGIDSFDSYLYQMARNAVINWYHKEERTHFTEIQPGINLSNHPSVEDEYLAKEIRLMVNLIVNRMPERRKQIYEMSRVQGIKNEEIAHQLNITKKTVEVQLNLALKEIRKCLHLLPFFLF